REARKEVDPLLLRDLAHPPAEAPEREDRLAVVHELRRNPGGLHVAVLREEDHLLPLDPTLDRSPLPPIREQLVEGAGIDDRAGELMLTDLAALLQDDDHRLLDRVALRRTAR